MYSQDVNGWQGYYRITEEIPTYRKRRLGSFQFKTSIEQCAMR